MYMYCKYHTASRLVLRVFRDRIIGNRHPLLWHGHIRNPVVQRHGHIAIADLVGIQPPLFPKECPVERVEFGGFPCSYCHGNGWFWGVDDYGERVKQDCPVCKGNKRLKAVVTVNWTADDSSNNQ